MSEPVVPSPTAELRGVEATDHVVDAVIVALQEFDTETLRRVIEHRHWDTDGWLPKMLREYLGTWRNG